MTTNFIDLNWLKTNPLTLETALIYFSKSPFYDKTCNNEILHMQSQFSSIKPSQLNMLIGIEYQVELMNSVLVINKIFRESQNVTRLLECYYIVYGTIYKAPTLSEIYNTRLYNAMEFLDKGIELYLEKRIFTKEGFEWRIDEKTEKLDDDLELSLKIINEKFY